MTKDRFKELLYSDEVTGSLISFCIMYEENLDMLISYYFGGVFKLDELHHLVVVRLPFYEKIDILKKMNIQRKIKSLENTVSCMESFRKLKNILVHNNHIPDAELENLYSDENVRRIIFGYPESLGKEKHAQGNRFTHLLHGVAVNRGAHF